MMCKCRWFAISVALGLTGLACARTTMPNIDAGAAGTSGASCSGLAAICGPSGNEDCCTSLLVPGGTFYRSYDGVVSTDMSYPATVADFYLDKYEITVATSGSSWTRAWARRRARPHPARVPIR